MPTLKQHTVTRRLRDEPQLKSGDVIVKVKFNHGVRYITYEEAIHSFSLDSTLVEALKNGKRVKIERNWKTQRFEGTEVLD